MVHRSERWRIEVWCAIYPVLVFWTGFEFLKKEKSLRFKAQAKVSHGLGARPLFSILPQSPMHSWSPEDGAGGGGGLQLRTVGSN